MALSKQDPANQLKNQIEIIKLINGSRSVNDFALSYRSALKAGRILGPDTILDGFARDVDGDELEKITGGLITAHKPQFIGIRGVSQEPKIDPWKLNIDSQDYQIKRMYSPYGVDWKSIDEMRKTGGAKYGLIRGGRSGFQKPYTDAEIMAMSPAQIDKLFTGGTVLPRTGAGVFQSSYDVSKKTGIPQLGGYTPFLDGLSKGTFSNAYNQIKNADPEFLVSQVQNSYEAAGKKIYRRGLDALIPGLIKGAALAGFGAGATGLFTGAGATAVANPSSIAGVIANNSANVAALTGEAIGGSLAAGSALSPSGGITTLGGAGQGATATSTGVTLPSGTSIPLAANPFNVPGATGLGGITTAAGAPGGDSLLSTVKDSIDNVSDIADLFSKNEQSGVNAGDSQQQSSGATAATGALGAAALAAAGSDNGDVSAPPSFTVGASPTKPAGLLSQAANSSTSTTNSSTTTQPSQFTGGTKFHAASPVDSDATNANVLKVGGLF